MKTRSRERMAELLLEELFAQLGEREEIKRMLGDLTSLPMDEVIAKLSADFEKSLARRSQEALETIREREVPPPPPEPEPAVVPPPPAQAPEVAEPAQPPSIVPDIPPPPPLPVQPVASAEPETSPVEPPAPAEPVPAEGERPPAEKSDKFWGELEDAIHGIGAVGVGSESSGPVDKETGSEEDFQGTLAQADAGELRTAVEFGDEDLVYLHGVTVIPATQTPSDHPFMLEEKGIDGRSFAFAFDYEGMRFYLSKVQHSSMNVSKTGMLLLGKQESLQVRGAHEAVLNDLRLHGILLPFAFGTLARGRDELLTKVDAHREALAEAIEAMMATRWWAVRLYVLDARIAQLVAKDEVPSTRKGRTVERASYTKVPLQKKFDIKMLERILSKEKRVAESVHEELKNVAERSDIDVIVGLGSGSSEDWKLILQSSYEVKPSALLKFFHAVADLQYRHLVFDLLLALSGDREPYSFRPE